MLCRQRMVVGIFEFVSEIHELDNGYAFKFHRFEGFARRLADYLLFEGVNSPQLLFVLVVEPKGGGIWLRVCVSEESVSQIKTASGTDEPNGSLYRGTSISPLTSTGDSGPRYR